MGCGIMRRRGGRAKTVVAPAAGDRDQGGRAMAPKGRIGWAATVVAATAAAGCSLPNLSLPDLPRDSTFSFETQYWLAEPGGHVDVEAGQAPATSTHAGLERDLNLDDDEPLLWQAALDLGEHRVSAEYLPLSFSGRGATNGFSFHGAVFPNGDTVSSDLDLETWAVKWDYALSKQKRTADAFRLGLGAWWWDLDLAVNGNPSGNAESREFSRVYPGVHALMTMELGESSTLDLAGAVAASNFHRRLYDWNATLHYPVSDYVRLGAGYRWLIFDFNETTNDGDFHFEGPFGALQIRF
jgi:hypothetical protein